MRLLAKHTAAAPQIGLTWAGPVASAIITQQRAAQPLRQALHAGGRLPLCRGCHRIPKESTLLKKGKEVHVPHQWCMGLLPSSARPH